jgi:hypothetical protein
MSAVGVEAGAGGGLRAGALVVVLRRRREDEGEGVDSLPSVEVVETVVEIVTAPKSSPPG